MSFLVRGIRRTPRAFLRPALEDAIIQAEVKARVDELVSDAYTQGFTDGVVATASLALGETIDGVEGFEGETPSALRVWLDDARRKAQA